MNVQTNNEDFNGVQITVRDGALTVTSRQVAEHFGKQHKNVLQSIRNLECSEEFNRLNFKPDEFIEKFPNSTERRIEYHMTRDGFTFLVMGFTGKEAARWKEKYIAAFNAMEQRLRASPMPAPMADLSDPGVLLPLLTSYAQRTQVAEGRVAELSPKAIAYDRLDASEGAVNVRIASKMLNVPERKFSKWLEANGWAFRQNGIGPLQAYVDKRNRGYLEHRPHTYHDSQRGEDKTVVQMMITPKGLARLAQIFAKQGAPA
jgi:Rha family phage regulatory protein